MLSPLQERVAHVVVGLAGSDGFALAGGAVLILRGEVDRRTRDLDFFGPSAVAVDRLVPSAEQALAGDGLQVAVRTWKERALDYAREHERIRGVRRDRGLDLGFGR